MSEEKKFELPIETALLDVVKVLRLVAPIKRDPLLRLAMAEISTECGCPEARQ